MKNDQPKAIEGATVKPRRIPIVGEIGEGGEVTFYDNLPAGLAALLGQPTPANDH